jgi:hypothetical protein
MIATRFVLAASLIAAAGCAPSSTPRVAVSGHVTYNGAQVSDASIFFIPDIDKEGVGGNAMIWNGRYSIPAESGPSPGEFNVTIVDTRRTNPDYQTSSNAPLLPPRFAEMGELHVTIPARRSFSFDFKLSDEPDTARPALKVSGAMD